MNREISIPRIKLRAAELRRRIVDMDFNSSNGHVGGALSSADIFATLFFGVLNHSPEKSASRDPERDRFVLSKGHISDAYYAVLAMSGYFPIEELDTYCAYNSRLSGHPTNHIPGIEINTGALGHGLSIAVGIAQGLKIDSSKHHVYTLLGDGELAEGSVWEAAMSASHYNLDNLTAIIDRNGLQIGGSTEQVMALDDLAAKWSAFGWDVIEVDGHDIPRMYDMFQTQNSSGKPRVFIANTVKGKGISYMENRAEWHHGVMSPEQYIQACDELQIQIDKAASEAGVATLEIKRHIDSADSAVDIASPNSELTALQVTKKTIPTRQAVTNLLVERAADDPRIVALTSDARGSAILGKFAKTYPDRFIEVGIAEQNEVGIAAGLSLTGKIPFVCAPACFLSGRSYEQVKVDLAYSRTNVKLLGVSGGLAYAALGQSHHSLQDIAVMRSLPGMNVVVPADANSARALADKIISLDGPYYIRVGRAAVADVYDAAYAENLVVGKAAMLREGKDAAIIACGTMVSEGLKTAELLERDDISVALFDMHTIKPLDTETIFRAAEKYGKIITIEEHVTAGGLGSAVCETLSETSVPVKVVALPDEDMVCGSEREILEHYGMVAEKIYPEVREWLRRR